MSNSKPEQSNHNTSIMSSDLSARDSDIHETRIKRIQNAQPLDLISEYRKTISQRYDDSVLNRSSNIHNKSSSNLQNSRSDKKSLATAAKKAN